jgi:repressor of nif and glnA expression
MDQVFEFFGREAFNLLGEVNPGILQAVGVAGFGIAAQGLLNEQEEIIKERRRQFRTEFEPEQRGETVFDQPEQEDPRVVEERTFLEKEEADRIVRIMNSVKTQQQRTGLPQADVVKVYNQAQLVNAMRLKQQIKFLE